MSLAIRIALLWAGVVAKGKTPSQLQLFSSLSHLHSSLHIFWLFLYLYVNLYLNFVFVCPNCIWCILVFWLTHSEEVANTWPDQSKTCVISSGFRIFWIWYLFKTPVFCVFLYFQFSVFGICSKTHVLCIFVFSWFPDGKQETLLSPVCLLRTKICKMLKQRKQENLTNLRKKNDLTYVRKFWNGCVKGS